MDMQGDNRTNNSLVKIQKEKIMLCFKYHTCKLCPRNAKCEKEQKESIRLRR